MKNVIAFCAILISLLVSSCVFNGRRVKGNGKLITEKRSVKKAERIKLSGSMNVVLTKGQTAVKVEADENLLQYILVEEEDGWLTISTRKGIAFTEKNPIVVFIATPTIKQVSVAGSGDVTSDVKYEREDEIKFSVSGSGDISVPVHAPMITVNITGSGNIKPRGETRDLKLSITGSGNFGGGELKAENADVNITGSGDARVFADVRLKANIVGSGDITYQGNPTIEKRIVGSGSISKGAE
jgi:hypothetical protein